MQQESAAHEPPALRLPHVSPERLSRLRRLFGLLQALGSPLAARFAFWLFLRPFRRPLRAGDATILARARRHTLKAGPDAVTVFEWGSGQRTAVIVHGWGSRAARFAPLADALLAQGWRVLAFDAPGHGDSPGTSSSLPRFIRALDAVTSHFGPPQALIGHSLGALAIACRHDPVPPPWAASLRAVVLISMPSGAPFLVENFVSMLGIRNAAHRRLLGLFEARFGHGPGHYVALSGVARITAPLLLIHDRDDDIVPPAHGAAAHAALPRTQLLTTTGLGHSTLTRDPATIAAIVDFLRHTGTLRVRPADLADVQDAAAVVQLLDAYARDPRGGGEPLPAPVRERLIDGLRAHPMARVWIAFDGDTAIGVCVGFIGYSTFQARPLLNIHDLAVTAGYRGRGAGQALLDAAETLALELGCCKLTLEVQDDNAPAQRLYARCGFRDVRYGNSGPTKFLAKPLPDPPRS